jgi:hypothetical protein
VFEVCVDVPTQQWEARAVIFDLQPDAVADTVAEEIRYEPELDARLTGCDRCTLHPEPAMGEYLCYVAEGAPTPAAAIASDTHAARTCSSAIGNASAASGPEARTPTPDRERWRTPIA